MKNPCAFRYKNFEVDCFPERTPGSYFLPRASITDGAISPEFEKVLTPGGMPLDSVEAAFEIACAAAKRWIDTQR